VTKREYYDLLVKTSLEGGFPAMDGFSCAYRAESGRRCALGVIIPDEHYRPQMESAGNIYGLSQKGFVTESEPWFPEGVTFQDLYEVQDAHDGLSSTTHPWDHEQFVRKLSRLSCFKEFTNDAA
jgi:hypothetical protein